jgi:predicted DNA-binding ribbon-helix-helix protein
LSRTSIGAGDLYKAAALKRLWLDLAREFYELAEAGTAGRSQELMAAMRKVPVAKSSIAKRSIVFNDKKTSVSLEDEFWNALKEIAGKRAVHISNLVGAINEQRGQANLSSALRLFVLDYYQSRRSDAQ